MANPPVNRRPGVDADIIQGTWVRGYDVPAGDQTLPPPSPCDLIVSNGKSAIDGTVSNLLFANRVDNIDQPIFQMVLGADPTSPIGNVNVHIGEDPDPNGVITNSLPGSLYASYGDPSLWQLQSDGVTWVQISDNLGGEDLQQTLAIGNTTGGFNILLTNGDFLKGEDSSVGTGAPANIAGGNATGLAGDGGEVYLVGGTSVGGITGGVRVETPTATSTGGSGGIRLQTGSSQLGGNAGGLLLLGGTGGDVGFGGDAGSIALTAGRNRSTGAGAHFGGNVNISAGQATSEGEGGSITLRAGPSFDGNILLPGAVPAAGQGGNIFLLGGLSQGAQTGGSVFLAGASGGSAGANGGSIIMNPGSGGGGFDDGEAVVNGIFRSDNIKRGSGNPNGSVAGNEGDVYQRTDTGVGQIWLNVSGSINGWVQLAAVGSLIENYEQLTYGYFSRAGTDLGLSVEDAWSDVGFLKGLRSNSIGGVDPTFGGQLENGPFVDFEPGANVGDSASVDLKSGASSLPNAREQRFITTFRARNTGSVTATRIFLGLSSADAPTQLSASLPGGIHYMGFLLDGGIGGTWRVITSNGLGVSGPFDTGVSGAATAAIPSGWHFIIDTTNDLNVTFLILDPDLQVQSTIVVPIAGNAVPTLGEPLGVVMGDRRLLFGSPTSLEVVHASIVTDADVSGQGGGPGGGSNLTLAQVLLNGNETGLNNISVNNGFGLLGAADDNLGDGANVGVSSGTTTLATNSTGTLTLGSASVIGAGATNAGETTGDVLLSSGFQLDVATLGDTGMIDLQTGDHLGASGSTGDLMLRTGGFTNAAAGTRTQGDVIIAAGSTTPNTATVTGEVIIKGGSTNISGVAGGDVSIMSGESAGPIGNTGALNLETFSANLDGNSGAALLASGNAGSNAGTSGNVSVATGNAVSGSTGALTLLTGTAGNGQAGPIVASVGSTTAGDGADINLVAGLTTDGLGTGGNIVLTPGTGPAGDGEVTINGKLTVTGLIDPTGLVLDGQASVPTTLAVGQGLLWVDNTASPSRLIFTDDLGTDSDISNGGGATTLGALTDVTLTAPALGEVLTFNGAQWVNLAGVGGSPLSTILGLGNDTGGTAGGIVVSDSLGDRITSDGDLVLDPAVAPGDAVVIDGLRWPEADGASGFVLTTNGSGQLSFQPGGGGSGPSFGEAFTRMQWGSTVPTSNNSFSTDGFFGNTTFQNSILSNVSVGPNGYFRSFGTAAAPGDTAGFGATVAGAQAGLELGALPVVSFKFDGPNLDTNVRFFVGLSSVNTFAAQTGLVAPLEEYVGIQLYTDVPQTTLQFVTDAATGTPTRQNTATSALGTAFELVLDASVAGEVTLSLYDNTGAQLATHTFTSNLPVSTTELAPMVAMTTTNATGKFTAVYGINAVTRADLLNAAGGGGGNQNLASVLGFGSDTGGVPISGSDSLVGAGGALALQGGDSNGGAGDGGAVSVTTGSPDGAGNGTGGDFEVTASAGAGIGDGGGIQLAGGDGGPAGGDGGLFLFDGGVGVATGSGGGAAFNLGDGGATGGDGGSFFVFGGEATGGNGAGGRVEFQAGDGFGTGNGGGYLFTAGDGGPAGGDGGSFVFTPGGGMGGGADGTVTFNSDVTVNGKLNVTGLIDPTGLLIDSQPVVPFTPAGTDGGIWVNTLGELVFTNAGGDLNLSTAIGGGITWLDALLTVGYGFLGAGNPLAGPQSYGVYGSSVVSAVSPGPPPASATFSDDTEGPFLNLAVAASPGSEAFLGASDLFVRRDQAFKSRFKFQVTSPAHADERLFIGFTDDSTAATPSVQLSADDPPALQYVGLRQDLAGVNLEFVARGSGGAMVPVLAAPTDTSVRYLEIDASAASGDVTFTLYEDDGLTVVATHTEPASFLLPDLANAMRPFTGIYTQTGTTPRGIDFYFSSLVTRADVVDAVTGMGGGGGGGLPTLEQVLGTGNTTGANSIVFSSGSAGITSEAAAPNTGTAGALLPIILGAGSAETGTGVAGGAGATLSVVTGSGGDTDAAAASGGVGGSLLALLGSGGDNTGGDNGGNGGSLGLTSGPGGVATGATGDGGDGGTILLATSGGGTSANANGGDAGSFTLNLGNGGAGNGDGGEGGSATFSAGDGGTATAGIGGEGGSLLLTAGDGGAGPTNGNGGFVTIQGGTSPDPAFLGGVEILAPEAFSPVSGEGSVVLAASPFGGAISTESYLWMGPGTSAVGGTVDFATGDAPAASGGNGGSFFVNLGAGDGAGDGGSFFILGDGASALPLGNAGGNIQLSSRVEAGVANGGSILAVGASPGSPGGVLLLGGDAIAASGSDGGGITVSSGAGDGAGDGGNVTIEASSGGATGDGGGIELESGNGGGVGNTGGNIRLNTGSGTAGDGEIVLDGRLNDSADGFQMGTFTPGGAPASFAVPFNGAFSAAPRVVQFTIEASTAALGGANNCSPAIAQGSITNTEFTLNMNFGGPQVGPYTVHWVAYL